jgi:hypothetical protein
MAKAPAPKFSLLSLAFRLGLQITIPLILFVALGVFLDSQLGTKPLFTFSLMPPALGISIYIIHREVLKPYLQEMEQQNKQKAKRK